MTLSGVIRRGLKEATCSLSPRLAIFSHRTWLELNAYRLASRVYVAAYGNGAFWRASMLAAKCALELPQLTD